MTNLEKYEKAFMDVLEISKEECKEISKNDMKWDSVGHMMLITELEEIFGIEILPEDILEFDSFENGKKIIKKYGIEIFKE